MAFVVGEPCWPATSAAEVVLAIRDLGYAVLGVELWELDEAVSPPRVVGWSDYSVDASDEWSQVVDQAAALAVECLADVASNVGLLVNMTWVSKDEFAAIGDDSVVGD